MLSRKSSRRRALQPGPAPDPAESRPITVVPPGGGSAVRSNLQTLVDEVELEAARLESMRRSSVPPPPPAANSTPPPADEINVEWAPEPTTDADDRFSGYAVVLGAFSRVPLVRVPFEELSSLSMDSRMGFLVALVDGSSTIQNILDVAGMPEREVLHALVTLREAGIIGFRDE